MRNASRISESRSKGDPGKVWECSGSGRGVGSGTCSMSRARIHRVMLSEGLPHECIVNE